MKKLLIISSVIIGLTFLLGSCTRNNDNNVSCPGTLAASWKVNGTTYESYVYVWAKVGSLNNYTLTACVNDKNDKTVQLAFIPNPPAVGSYPLRWDATTGIWNGYSSGEYFTDEDGNYATDSTTYTGSFDVTAIDTTNKTISGGFHFSAREINGGSRTINITDGIFTKLKYDN